MKAFLMATSVGMFTLAGIWIADRYAYRCVILENMLRFCRSVRMQSVMFARPLVQQCTQATDMDRFLAAQQEGLNACQTELERLLAQAQGYRARYATLYAKLGLLAGIAAAILIW